MERYREQADRLLANVLSAPIADRLTPGEGTIADRHRNVTVLFADIVAFSQLHHWPTPQRSSRC